MPEEIKKQDTSKQELEADLPVVRVYHLRLQGADLLALTFLAGVLYAIIVFKLME